jgi:uncharacterized protein YqgC (DUF456 family)
MGTELLYAIGAVLILVGLLGTVLPVIPGAPVMLVGMVLAAWAGDFERVGGKALAILAVLTALSVGSDFAASALGAKGVGASRLAFLGAVLGAVVGVFFGLPGLLLGPLLGAVIGELIATQNIERATRSGIGAAVGLIVGALAKLAIAFTMLGVFIVALWR